MATQILTKSAIDALRQEPTAYLVWDSRLKGFGVKVLPTGRKVFVVQYRPRTRAVTKRFTLGAYGALTVDQARRNAQEVLGSVAGGADPAVALRADKEAPTVAGLAPRYIKRQGSLRAGRKAEPKASATWTQRLFDSYILPAFGSRAVADITRADVAKFHERLRGKPVQANRVLAVLSGFCSWTEKEGFRPGSSNPCRGVDRFPEQGREHFLNGEELARLGSVLREAETVGLPPSDASREGYAKGTMTPPERLPVDTDAVEAIRLLLFTGCRKSEILGLQWSEVDFQRGLLVFGDSKTGKSTRPLNAPARAVLDRLPHHATSKYVFPGLDPEKHRVEINRAWTRIRKAAGLDQVRLHDLRHTHATVGVSSGASLPLIGGLLGHSQASTTQRYAHVMNHPLAVVSERVGADMAAALAGSDTPVTPLRRKKVGLRSK